jgi:chromosomal replication initiator protein
VVQRAQGRRLCPPEREAASMRNVPAVTAIQERVANYFDMPVSEIMSKRRGRGMRPRQIAMYLARELTPCSFPEIGRRFNRDHSTVMHNVAAVKRLAAIDEKFAADLAALRGAV